MNPLRIGNRQFTLEELLEFNDLLASVVRGQAPAGTTLEVALPGVKSRFRLVLSEIVTRIQRGETIADAIDAQPEIFPTRYREVVRAGENGGFLGVVLISYSSYVRQLIALRRRMSRALIYPIVVMITAYLLFVLVGQYTNREFLRFYAESRLETTWLLRAMELFYDNMLLWAWIPPLLMLFAWVAWVRSNDGRMLTLSGAASFLRLIPGMTRIVKLHRLANFTELMSLLLTSEVPFSQAFQIAAQASGDSLLIQFSQDMPGEREARRLPPFLSWLIQMGGGDMRVGQPMSHAAQMYRRRADQATEWLKLLAPLAFMVLIGGGTALAYTLTVFLPFTDVLNEFS